MNQKKIGKKLRNLRGSRTQKEVATAIGVSTMAISQYERGERVPQDDIKIALANYYKEPIGDLFY